MLWVRLQPVRTGSVSGRLNWTIFGDRNDYHSHLAAVATRLRNRLGNGAQPVTPTAPVIGTIGGKPAPELDDQLTSPAVVQRPR